MHEGVPIFVYSKAKMFVLIQNSKMEKIPWLWPRLQMAIHRIQELIHSCYKHDIFVFSHHSLYKQDFGKHQTKIHDLENPCPIYKKTLSCQIWISTSSLFQSQTSIKTYSWRASKAIPSIPKAWNIKNHAL